jgi:nicotinamide N-methyltransferase
LESLQRHPMNDGDDEEDEYDYFESSMESLFGQHQPASGKPGQKCRLLLEGRSDNTRINLEYRIPTNESSSNTRLFAHYQWDAGVHLARMLFNSSDERECNEISVKGKTIVELGAGTGLPSLVCARDGASSVVITDYPDNGIMAAMKENIKTCRVEDAAHAQGLDWADAGQVEDVLRRSPNSEGYDLILCADVLWLSSSHADLLETVQKLLRKSSSSRILLLSGFHTGRRALSAFFSRAMDADLLCDWDREDGGVFEYNVVTDEKRSWSGRIPFPVERQSNDSASDQNEREEEDNMDDYTERTKWLLFVSLRWSNPTR